MNYMYHRGCSATKSFGWTTKTKANVLFILIMQITFCKMPITQFLATVIIIALDVCLQEKKYLPSQLIQPVTQRPL